MELLAPELFLQVAREHPHRSAIEITAAKPGQARQSVSYAELAARAQGIARALHAPLEPDARVALAFERNSIDLYAAQLGVLIAGGAFLSLDPAHPTDRLRWIVSDAEPRWILTDSAHLDRSRELGLPSERCLAVDRIEPSAAAVRFDAPQPHHLAYVIYTSGTTGRPKGVLIEHRSLANLIHSDIEVYELQPGVRVAQCSSPVYDSSIEETWLAFSVGGTLVPLDDDTLRSGPDLLRWLREERIEVLSPAPTVLRSTGCRDPRREVPDLKLLYVGGEAMTEDLAQTWGRDLWLENGYGPTECTVTVVRGRIRPDAPITIGQAVRGHRALVLNEQLEAVPEGEVGELCLSGIGLARGYLGLHDLTAERFPEHAEWGRIYRTGDLAFERDGILTCLGRADSQVKIRGHRIELDEVDAVLARVAGVDEGAAFIMSGAAGDRLAAWVVPSDPNAPPDPDAIREALHALVPGALVPSLIGICADLPRTDGGKRDRKQLPPVPEAALEASGEDPQDEWEAMVAGAYSAALGHAGPGLEANFFHELGGDSLRAAMVVTQLRDDERTAAATVRDLYEHPTVRTLARHLREQGSNAGQTNEPASAAVERSAWPVGLIQGAILLAGLAITGAIPLVVFQPSVIDLFEAAPLWMWLILAPALGQVLGLLWLPLATSLTLLAKKILIGRYREGRHPAWGSFHLRHWIVTRFAAGIPWGMIAGTTLTNTVLRALGARVGQRVHFHRGVNLAAGGWDLLEIGDDVTLGRDVQVRTIDLQAGSFALAKVRIEDGVTLETRSGVAGGSVAEAGAWIGPLASVTPRAPAPRNQRVEGVPASVYGPTPALKSPAAHDAPSQAWHTARHLLAGPIAQVSLGLPGMICLLGVLWGAGVDTAAAAAWLREPAVDTSMVALAGLLAAALLAIWLVAAAIATRLTGPRRALDCAVGSWTWLRVWFAMGWVERAGNWLSGTLLWPAWLRAAGMQVGKGCEISSIMEVVPSQVQIGAGSFFADGIYLGVPRIHRGRMQLAPTRVGADCFFGNHAILPAGTQLEDGILLGVATIADDPTMPAGSSWFGNPAFELPRREIVTMDPTLTHAPTRWRILNRWVFELARFGLPAIGVALLATWFSLGQHAHDWATWTLLSAAAAGVLVGGVLAAKWILLGRVRPGQHGLWSGWCARWDLLYMLWARLAQPILTSFEQTPYLPLYLRAMGARIGRKALLGRGFAQLVDPDMLTIEAGATFQGLLQAHSFEDRVLKIDRVHVGQGATVGSQAILLYGADVGEAAHVEAHSVVMKRERLLSGRRYGGCPVRPTTKS